MSEKNTGGEAFPIASLEGDIAWGLTLRDHMAGLAMQGITSLPQAAEWTYGAVAAMAYEQADAMRAARENGGPA